MHTQGEWKVLSQYACGCQIRMITRPTKQGQVESTIIEHCPKHRAAEDMYQALKRIASCEKRADGDVVDIARKALAKAEAKS